MIPGPALTDLVEPVVALIDLGGPVVAALGVMSVIAAALILLKLWHFLRAGVGRHEALNQALDLLDGGEAQAARRLAATSRSHLAPLALLALGVAESRDPTADNQEARRNRLSGLAETALSRLQSGFRALDSIAQVAPLLGLFGTVLGMIEAFQALQGAGAAVDPSALAGGIWVALLTTAVGLGVAMPTALMLSFLDSRVAAEARMAARIVDVALCAGLGVSGSCPMRPSRTERADNAAPGLSQGHA